MERRRHPRIPVEQVMEARLIVDGVDAVGRVLDLNNAGAFVETDLVLPKNARLEIELRLKSADESVPLRAVVARHSEAVQGRHTTIPAGLGIVFLTANVMERSFIQKAVLEALRASLETTRALTRSAQPAGAPDAPIPSENSSR